jgi:hypothetical protein
MPGSYRLATPLLALALLPALAGRTEAQAYRDADHHFSIELPRGWEPMTKSEVDSANFFVGGRLPGFGVMYSAGLRRKTDRLGNFPYVLIQCVSGPPSGSSYEELEKSLLVDLSPHLKAAQSRVGDIVKDMNLDKPVLDRKSNTVRMYSQSTVNGFGTVKGISIGHLGRDNVIFVHCYAKADSFDSCMPTFRNINNWLSFDPGYEFKQGKGSSLFSWSGAGRGGLTGGLIGLGVGLVGYFARLISQAGKVRTQASADRGLYLDQLPLLDDPKHDRLDHDLPSR